MQNTPYIDFDEKRFSPMEIMPVSHSLADHTLLQLPALVELADRMPERFIRFHKGDITPGASFENAPAEHRVNMKAAEVIRRIEEAGAWLSLHHIQQDKVYRELVAEILESVRSRVEAHDPGMHSFAGWIFVSAPFAVTPYHMDHEHNFILQLRGEKEVHVFDPLAREVVTERCLETFHRTWSRELVTYEESHEQHAQKFNMTAGDGAYMPTTAPHWVKNGAEVSVTVSFTYYSDEVRRRERLHQYNWLLRRVGMRPTPVGQSASRDSLKSLVAKPLLGSERVLRRWPKLDMGSYASLPS